MTKNKAKTSNLKEYPVSSLLEMLNPINPRRISADARVALVESLNRFGVVEPIIINLTTGRVVGGHQRIKVAAESDLATLPVVELELEEDKEMALNLALNKIGGTWDFDKLHSILNGIEVTDLSVTGFSGAEVDAIVDRYAQEAEDLVNQNPGGGDIDQGIQNLTEDQFVDRYKSLIPITFGMFGGRVDREKYEAWIEGVKADSTQGESPAALGAVIAQRLGLTTAIASTREERGTSELFIGDPDADFDEDDLEEI